MKVMATILLALTLASCAPVMEISTPKTVMLSNVDQFNATEAFKMAEEECLKNNRHAVAIPDNIRDGRQSYECKD